MQYILMNKDELWASFSCVQDEFGEENAVLNEWYTDLRPLGLQSLTAWLEKRKAPKHRKPHRAAPWSSTAALGWRNSFM